tara:strand:+ start:671 stop:1153 length:483 start_codon:yes stop_codon:yes gene_type:complete
MNIENYKFINHCLNFKKIISINYNIYKLKYENTDFTIFYKYIPYFTVFVHFLVINYLLKNIKKSITKECKDTINFYFTNKIKCFKFHIKPRRNVLRKTPNQYKVDNTEKTINEINFSNFEEFYEYQYPIIKEFYDNFTDEQICNYALTLFESKFAIIKEN